DVEAGVASHVVDEGDDLRDRILATQRIQRKLDRDFHLSLHAWEFFSKPSIEAVLEPCLRDVPRDRLEAVLERYADMPRIAEPHIELVRKIGRLIAEEKAPDGVSFIEQVARPELD